MTIGLPFAFDQAPSLGTVGFDERRLLAADDVPLGDSRARSVDIAPSVDDGAPLEHALPGWGRMHNIYASGYDGRRIGNGRVS